MRACQWTTGKDDPSGVSKGAHVGVRRGLSTVRAFLDPHSSSSLSMNIVSIVKSDGYDLCLELTSHGNESQRVFISSADIRWETFSLGLRDQQV